MDKMEMKDQAKYIWNRLDDLANTDPDGYKKFIEQQMKEREIFMSSPEPRICFVTEVKQDGVVTDLYVNVCAWKRLPYPANDSEPLKLMSGFKLHHKEFRNCKRHITVPVAVNEKILEELLKSTFDKDELILLIIQFLKHQLKMDISNKYKIYKELFKGDLPANPRTLFVSNPQSEFSESDIRNLTEKGKIPSDILSSPETLLEQLSTEEKSHNISDGPENDFIKTFMKREEKNEKKLIEEVEKPTETPHYILNEREKDGNQACRYCLKINLPLIKRASDCDLTISSNEIELIVPEKYYLKVLLPKAIEDSSAKARFSKKTSCLTLDMPIK